MPTPILAISGPIGVGKSSLMDFFRRDGYNVIHQPIANPLKAEVRSALNLDRQWMEDNKNLVRPMLVTWAEFKRAITPTYWIDKTIDILGPRDEIFYNQYKGNDVFVVDDMRYANEAEALKAIGATLVYLDCQKIGSANYMVSKGLSLSQARAILESQGETELYGQPSVFDIRIDAPRMRPLRSTYDELLFELLKRNAIEGVHNG